MLNASNQLFKEKYFWSEEELEPTRRDIPPNHTSGYHYDETAYPTQMNRNEHIYSYDRRKSSKIVLVPIFILLFVAGVAAGFFLNQRGDADNALPGYDIGAAHEEELVIETPETMRNQAVSGSDGVSLSNVWVIESHNYRTEDGLFIASQGHRYHESVVFSVIARGDYIDHDFSYAIFDLDNRFTTFTADVVARGTQPEYVEFSIEIAFDDIVEPEKTIEGFNVNMDPVPIELDVSGVSRMYIIVRGRGSNSHSTNGIRFGNPTLQ